MHGEQAWGNAPRPKEVPCKHICALFLRLVAQVDEHPTIIFGLRQLDPFNLPPPPPHPLAKSQAANRVVVNVDVEGGSESQPIEFDLSSPSQCGGDSDGEACERRYLLVD